MSEALGYYDPASLVESHTNPRQKVDVSDLVESVKAQGILEPLLGRLLEDGQIEVVFGRRRRAAALAVGLSAVPVLVRSSMSDAEVLEAQIVENRDRADVHPMEEAEAYEALLRMPHPNGTPRTTEDVAARVGVDVRYLVRRLALLKLDPAARGAFHAGRLETSVALLLATLRPADQKRALAEVGAPDDGSRGALPYRAALEFVRRSILLRLTDAPFDLKAEDLVPGVGGCGACPKRTGSTPNLFGEFEDAELCTDPACHAKKIAAGWARLAAAAEASGRVVLGEKEAADVFRFGATTASSDSGFVDLDDKCMEDPKERTYREILAGRDDAPMPVLGRDGRGGVHDLLPKAEARRAVRALLPKKAAERAEAAEAQTKAIEKAEADEKIRAAVLERAIAAFRKSARGGFPVRFVVEALVPHARETRRRWGLNDEETTIAKLKVLKVQDLGAIALEAALEKLGAFDAFMRGEESEFDDVAALRGVDLKKIRATIEKGEAEPKPKKKAKK